VLVDRLLRVLVFAMSLVQSGISHGRVLLWSRSTAMRLLGRVPCRDAHQTAYDARRSCELPWTLGTMKMRYMKMREIQSTDMDSEFYDRQLFHLLDFVTFLLNFGF